MAWSLEWTVSVVVESEVGTTNKTHNKLTKCYALLGEVVTLTY